MFESLRYHITDAIDRVQRRFEPEESHVIIKDGVILSEPPHDEEIDPNAEADAITKAQQIAQYHAYAQELCAQNRREGIWIELLLLGVQISSIKDGIIEGNQFHFRVKAKPCVAIIPSWCLDVMNQNNLNWRIERKSIHKYFARLEIIPEDVYRLAPNYES